MGRRLVAAIVGIAGSILVAGCGPDGEHTQEPGSSDPATPTTSDTPTMASAPSPVTTPTETVRMFDVERMNDDVHNVLVEHYRLDDVGAVSCPGNRPVEVDSTFACYVEVAGEQRKVTITVTGDDGSYEVGALQ